MSFRRIGEQFIWTPLAGRYSVVGGTVAAALTNGRFVVGTTVFGDLDKDGQRDEYGVSAVVYNADGSTIDTGVISEISHHGQQFNVTGLGDGRFVAIWTDVYQDSNTTRSDVLGQIFTANGTRIGGSFKVNTDPVPDPSDPDPIFDQQDGSVAKLANGGFVATWTEYRGYAAPDVRGQIFDETGSKVGSDFVVNTTTANSQGPSCVTGLANGRFVVTWYNGSANDLRAQIFGSGGAKVGSEFVVGESAVFLADSSVTALADGKFVVTWSSDADDGQKIRGQVFNAQGFKLNGEFVESGIDSTVRALADGRFVLSWRDDGVRAQVFAADGTKSGAELDVNGKKTGGESSIAALDDGSFVVTWSDDGVHGQKFDPTKYSGNGTDETVIGGDFADDFKGAGGDDRLKGEWGDDTLTGGAGDDVLDGSFGRDTAVFESSIGNYGLKNEKIFDARADGTDGKDRFDGIELFDFKGTIYKIDELRGQIFTDNNDVVNFNKHQDILQFYVNSGQRLDSAMGGDDTIYLPKDIAERGMSRKFEVPDWVKHIATALNPFNPGAGNDTVHCNDGNNFIEDSPGKDTYDGKGGEDTLVFKGNLSDYKIKENYNKANRDKDDPLQVFGRDGSFDTVSNFEYAKFDNAIVSLQKIYLDIVEHKDGTARAKLFVGGEEIKLEKEHRKEYEHYNPNKLNIDPLTPFQPSDDEYSAALYFRPDLKETVFRLSDWGKFDGGKLVNTFTEHVPKTDVTVIRGGMDIHHGSRPGNSTGCIVTGQPEQFQQPLMTYLSSLDKTLQFTASKVINDVPLIPISVRVSGDVVQPKISLSASQESDHSAAKLAFHLNADGQTIADKIVKVFFSVEGGKFGKDWTFRDQGNGGEPEPQLETNVKTKTGDQVFSIEFGFNQPKAAIGTVMDSDVRFEIVAAGDGASKLEAKITNFDLYTLPGKVKDIEITRGMFKIYEVSKYDNDGKLWEKDARGNYLNAEVLLWDPKHSMTDPFSIEPPDHSNSLMM